MIDTKSVLEDLSNNVLDGIREQKYSLFANAIEDMSDYYRFLLDLNSIPIPETDLTNLAQLPEGSWSFKNTYHSWLEIFQIICLEASDRIISQPRFLKKLASQPLKILPNAREFNFSNRNTEHAINLAACVPFSLAKWRENRASAFEEVEGYASSKTALTSYVSSIRDFIEVWEILAQTLYWHSKEKHHLDTDADTDTDAVHWSELIRINHSLDYHLGETSYFLARSVWANDKEAVAIYEDTLLRWGGHIFTSTSYTEYAVQNQPQIVVFLDEHDWNVVKIRLGKLPSYFPRNCPPKDLFEGLIKHYYKSRLLIFVTMMAHWYLSQHSNKDLVAPTCTRLLKRDVSEHEGSLLEPHNAFEFQETFLQFCVLSDAAGTSYAASTDRFIAQLDRVTEREVIGGRIYQSTSIDSFSEMRLAQLAIFLRLVSARATPPSETILGNLIDNVENLPNGYASLERIVYYLQSLKDQIGAQLEDSQIEILRSFLMSTEYDGNFEASCEYLKLILDLEIQTLNDRCRRFISQSSISSKQVNLLNQKALENLSKSPKHYPWLSYDTILNSRAPKFGSVSRFRGPTIPKLDLLEDTPIFPSLRVKHVINFLGKQAEHYVWRKFTLHERRKIEIDRSLTDEAFWRNIRNLARATGTCPVMLLAHQNISLIRELDHENLGIKYERHDQQEKGQWYNFSIDDIDIYQVDFPNDQLWLFSRDVIKAVHYSCIPDDEECLTLKLDEKISENGEIALETQFQIKQCVEWSIRPIYELKLKKGEAIYNSSKF
ncbi:hypothetical protein [Pseudovibrio sp. Tun.PSC04-5.I4]|uniref:hypothetical protein n=1 Tax=Pseudovibrio sp. Tun.PSC04-5.I4 TaxID=1798213 RepID=UPI000882BB4B|nr:hypothetical protein [Pseudovibrio sp. Tun.PSC04-5.I4]SDR02632.1 hypothetical protein SAMN04515695_2380 [Pseudovibrio sp. Tun.PSC04-5.I4]